MSKFVNNTTPWIRQWRAREKVQDVQKKHVGKAFYVDYEINYVISSFWNQRYIRRFIYSQTVSQMKSEFLSEAWWNIAEICLFPSLIIWDAECSKMHK